MLNDRQGQEAVVLDLEDPLRIIEWVGLLIKKPRNRSKTQLFARHERPRVLSIARLAFQIHI